MIRWRSVQGMSPGPTAAVTATMTALAVTAGTPGGVVLVGAAVLTGRCRRLDQRRAGRRAGRHCGAYQPDKPSPVAR